MTELNAQKLLCDLGYETIDKMILESMKISFTKDNHEFRGFSLFEGQVSLNKLNIHEYNENPFIEFVYIPQNKIVTIENFAKYDIKKIIAKNMDISEYIDTSNELEVYKMKTELCGMTDMLVEYITCNDDIKDKIVDYMINTL